MKQILILFFAFLSLTICAQTAKYPFVIEITIDGQTATYYKEPCGFGAASGWGKEVTTDICGEMVWGYTQGDSLGCGLVDVQYPGKMVMHRRGVCEFGQKAVNAELSGGIASIIANGYLPSHQDACFTYDYAGIGDPSIQIPSVLFSRNMVEPIEEALREGKQVFCCFRPVNLYRPTAEILAVEPAVEGNPLDFISVRAFNRTGVSQTLHLKAEITDPNGTQTTLLSEKFMPIWADSLIRFPSYSPPLGLVGTYQVQYTCEEFTGAVDTLHRVFQLSPHTWALDNLDVSGVFPVEPLMGSSPSFQIGALIRTGGVGGPIKWGTFGLENPEELVGATFNFLLMDIDPDNDGCFVFESNSGFFTQIPIVSFADFNINAATAPGLMTVEIEPIDGNNLLKPHHFYYLVLSYLQNDPQNPVYPILSGCPGITSINLETPCVNSANIPIVSNPVFIGNYPQGYHGSYTPVLRLHDAFYIPNSLVPNLPSLNENKWTISPNPASDFIEVGFDLEDINKKVVLQIMDLNGRIISTFSHEEIQHETLRYHLNTMPTGTYLIHVVTSQEGSGIKMINKN